MAFQTITTIFGVLPFIMNPLQSHAVKTEGKEFYFAFFPYGRSDPLSDIANDVYISAVSDTTCTLTYDGGSRNIHFHITAGSISRQQLPDNSQLTAETGVQQKGIHLSCTESVRAYANNKDPTSSQNQDSYTLLPVELLSTEYLIPSTDNNPVIGVVASAPNTNVTVHLKSTCTIQSGYQRYSDGDVLEFSLAKTDVLEIMRTYQFFSRNCDFTGTLIKSTSPVAVFSGSIFYYIYGKVQSHMMVQVPPLIAYSKTTIVPHVPSPAKYMKIRIVPSQDNTSVSVISQPDGKNESSFIKDRMKPAYFSFTADQDLFVQSDKPVMVVQRILSYQNYGSMFMFIPGILDYDTNFILQNLSPRTGYFRYKPVITIVSETSEENSIYVNGLTPKTMDWRKINNTDYSIGTMEINETDIYYVNSTSSILVRLHLLGYSKHYGIFGGYRIPTETEKLRSSIDYHCTGGKWLLTIDVDGLRQIQKDIFNIYLGINTCTGVVQGNLLIFNVSWDQCHTEKTDLFGNDVYKTSLWYNALSADNITRNVQWLANMTCYAHTTSQVTTSGPIQGIPVEIQLFQNASYQISFVETSGNELIGQHVYVQVLARNISNNIMIINTCDAHLTNDLGRRVTRPLISNGCPVDAGTQVTENRNHVMRFQFQLLISPLQHGDIYVTCDVTFCNWMDFSPSCHLGCQHSALIGK